MIPACRLWEKTSAKGNRYLVGRLGGLRVLVMPNTRPEAGDDSTHVLMVTGAPQYSQAAPAEPTHAAPPAERHAHRGRRKLPTHDDGEPLEDDPLPF